MMLKTLLGQRDPMTLDLLLSLLRLLNFGMPLMLPRDWSSPVNLRKLPQFNLLQLTLTLKAGCTQEVVAAMFTSGRTLAKW